MSLKTLYDKLWDQHHVTTRADGLSLLYIDRHLLHEVTSPQAFESLRLASRQPWRLSANLAVPDHNVPTTPDRLQKIEDGFSRIQLQTLADNCAETKVPYIPLQDKRQGIVHIIGPELGATLPGMTVVCGDSHTSTHGALGTLAMGIGTSDVAHVLATQCLATHKMKNLAVVLDGQCQPHLTAKDIILAIIGKIGTAGGTGHAIEFQGAAIAGLDMAGRLTVCNMAIEAGARCGLIAVDDTTLEYVANKPFCPKGAQWTQAKSYWASLHSDDGAHFDKTVHIDAATLAPQVTWGTSPEQVCGVDACVPSPDEFDNLIARQQAERALAYMDLKPGTPFEAIMLDKVFIGSCTNSRIEDLRAAAAVIKGKRVADSIKLAMVVPGSGLVKAQAEAEGLDKTFKAAGFEWREPGCSMCIAMNPDKLAPGERCASTSNRNFEGRQGSGGRTHLVSPAMAALAAVHGHFVDVRKVYA